MRFIDLVDKYSDKQILKFMKFKDEKNLAGYKKMLPGLRKIKAKRCGIKIILHGNWDDDSSQHPPDMLMYQGRREMKRIALSNLYPGNNGSGCILIKEL